MNYQDFLEKKTHHGAEYGFEPDLLPDKLFDFQKHIVTWALRKGRAAIFADCGLGKTFMQLAWADNVARHTSERVLVLAPLAVAFQTIEEGHKLGIEITHRRDGIKRGDRLVVTNYERLHHFSPDDFAGVICDESSILKNFDGEMRKAITDFMRKRPYRLLATATAAPNDYIELGTSSEAIGELGSADMLSRFFKKSEKTFSRSEEYRAGLYRLRGHASKDFWRWVASWARAFRSPADIGFDADGFKLPPLVVRDHVVRAAKPRPGYLFDIPAVGLDEQRADLRNTIDERCDMAAQLINDHDRPAIAWCNLNEESKRLAKSIRGAAEVTGSDPEEKKESLLAGFVRGEVRVLVTKPTIGGFGLNFQHCAHETFFPSHSYEQYYQAVRRCWRFGQQNAVTVDMITTDGQENVLKNLQRKADQADAMFAELVRHMASELSIKRTAKDTQTVEVPSWL